MVYDTYLEKSLKGMTREKREPSLVPSNWKGFLRVDENKAELFKFLSSEIFKLIDGEIISRVEQLITSLRRRRLYISMSGELPTLVVMYGATLSFQS